MTLPSPPHHDEYVESDGLSVVLHGTERLHQPLIGTLALGLATAARAGLPVAEGVVLTHAAIEQIRVHGLPAVNYRMPNRSEPPTDDAQIATAIRDLWHHSARDGLLGVDLTTSPTGARGLVPHAVGRNIDSWSTYLHTLRRTIAATPTDVAFGIVAQRHIAYALTGTATMRRGPRRVINVCYDGRPDGGPDLETTIGAFGGLRNRSRTGRLSRSQRTHLAALIRRADDLFTTRTTFGWGVDEAGWFSLRTTTPVAQHREFPS